MAQPVTGGMERARTAPPPVLRGAVPLLGVLPELARDPLAVFGRARALDDVVRLAVPGRHPLFVLADPAHIRRLLQPAFRAERIRRFVETMAAAAAGLADRWEAAAAAGRVLDVSWEMSDL